MFDDFGILVGEYNSSLPTLVDGQKSELQLDESGRLIVSGRYLEDSAHASGDAGLFMMAVRNDTQGSLVDTDGDYAPLQVDADGYLRVAGKITVEAGDAEYLEDTAHGDGDAGLHMLAVRQDTLSSLVDADGDYASFKVNAVGELWVKDADTLAQLVTIDGVLDNILLDTNALVVDLAAIETELLDQGTTLDNIETELLDQGTTLDSIETEIQSITHAEDAAHVSGDSGVMSLAVRADTDGSLTDSDGDYAPLQVDAQGKLKIAGDVTITPPGSEAYTVTDALAVAGDGIETITAAATPWVTVASVAVNAGETAYIYGWQFGCDQNAQARLITDDTTDIIVYKNALNSSANPEKSEHWSSEGRIEVPGAANLEVKVQVKKRAATGGNANGTGSIHVRKI